MEVLFHHRVEMFVNNLDSLTRARLKKLINMVEDMGPFLGMPYSKSLGFGLFELRILSKPQVRVIYTFKGTSVYLLHGFIKKSQKLPLKDIRLALNRIKRLD